MDESIQLFMTLHPHGHDSFIHSFPSIIHSPFMIIYSPLDIIHVIMTLHPHGQRIEHAGSCLTRSCCLMVWSPAPGCLQVLHRPQPAHRDGGRKAGGEAGVVLLVSPCSCLFRCALHTHICSHPHASTLRHALRHTGTQAHKCSHPWAHSIYTHSYIPICTDVLAAQTCECTDEVTQAHTLTHTHAYAYLCADAHRLSHARVQHDPACLS